MARRAARTEPDDAPDETDAPDEDDKDPENGDSGDTDGDGLEDRIRAIVEKVVGGVLGDRPEAGPRATAAADEASIRRLVREAQDGLRRDEEKEQKFKSVADEVESLKAAVERPPARAGIGGKISRAFWGEE